MRATRSPSEYSRQPPRPTARLSPTAPGPQKNTPPNSGRLYPSSTTQRWGAGLWARAPLLPRPHKNTYLPNKVYSRRAQLGSRPKAEHGGEARPIDSRRAQLGSRPKAEHGDQASPIDSRRAWPGSRPKAEHGDQACPKDSRRASSARRNVRLSPQRAPTDALARKKKSWRGQCGWPKGLPLSGKETIKGDYKRRPPSL